MDFDLKDYINLATVGPICSAILVLYGAWRKVIRPLTNIIREDINERINRQKKQDQMMTDVAWIIDQMKPNGGSTIKDSLNRLENELHMVSQRQKIFVLDSPLAVFETDVNGEFIYANRTYCRWVGKSMEEILGRGWINSLHESTRTAVVEEWMHAIQDKREFSLEYNLKDEDGKPFMVHCTASPMYDRNKNISGWSGVIVKHDI